MCKKGKVDYKTIKIEQFTTKIFIDLKNGYTALCYLRAIVNDNNAKEILLHGRYNEYHKFLSSFVFLTREKFALCFCKLLLDRDTRTTTINNFISYLKSNNPRDKIEKYKSTLDRKYLNQIKAIRNKELAHSDYDWQGDSLDISKYENTFNEIFDKFKLLIEKYMPKHPYNLDFSNDKNSCENEIKVICENAIRLYNGVNYGS